MTDTLSNMALWSEFVLDKLLGPVPLFGTDRWDRIFHGDSYYFESQPFVKFRYDDIGESWYLTTVFNLKNYGDEIQKFLDWIEPWVGSYGHVGHTRYEEIEDPTLIYYDEITKKFVFKEVVN